MPKRLFDRLTLFGRARLDVPITTRAGRAAQRRYAVNFLDMSDPPREAPTFTAYLSPCSKLS